MFLATLFGFTLACMAFWALHKYASFSAQSPNDYQGVGNPFDIREALDGPMLCEGVIYGPLGRVTSRFVAHMNATWDGNVGTMTEEFEYDTGSTQSRIWHLKVHDDGTFDATAPDIIGTGSGTQAGSGVELFYTLKLPQDAGGHVLKVADWMYLMGNGTVMNRSQMRKFGVKVAELVATMRKVP